MPHWNESGAVLSEPTVRPRGATTANRIQIKSRFCNEADEIAFRSRPIILQLISWGELCWGDVGYTEQSLVCHGYTAQLFIQGVRKISAIIVTDKYVCHKEPKSAYNFFLL